MNILFVEDSEAVRREIEAQLRELPVVDEVVSRAGVEDARRSLEGEAFDLWVLDFQLEDGTALDLLKDRSLAPGSPRSNVIVLTNHATPLVRDRCLQAGADHFFDKTNDLDQVLATVETIEARPDAS